MSPYRSIEILPVIAKYIPPLSHRLIRQIQKLLIWVKGSYLKRYPWPCLKCGNRRMAQIYRMPDSSTNWIDPKVIWNRCCGNYHHADKHFSNYYTPFHRQNKPLVDWGVYKNPDSSYHDPYNIRAFFFTREDVSFDIDKHIAIKRKHFDNAKAYRRNQAFRYWMRTIFDW